jgi:sporulation protein YlmC with PRC-barrel domain
MNPWAHASSQAPAHSLITKTPFVVRAFPYRSIPTVPNNHPEIGTLPSRQSFKLQSKFQRRSLVRKIIALSAALSMIGATAAMSQTTTQPQTTPPTTGQQQTTPPVGVPPSPQVEKAPAPGMTATTPKSGQHTFLNQQQSGQLLASDLMRKNILGANNERIGDVNDLLMSKDGEVVAVLVGVGGFLGIGEKTVAIPFDTVQRSPDSDQLSVQYSRDELKQAPEFVTAKRSERSTGTTGTTGTTRPSGTQR